MGEMAHRETNVAFLDVSSSASTNDLANVLAKMKQVTQNIRTGELSVPDVPEPAVAIGEVLIANQASLVSAGTEKMVLDLAKKSLFSKARERPDQIRRMLEKIRHEGLSSTIRQVRKKLDQPVTMGYSSAGIVVACGAGVQEFKPGDRVASNGPHAEVVTVPRNLCAHVPENVSFDQACFAILGSIALQGIRLSQCQIGETVFVIGLGLVGQLTVSLAKAAGLRVIGTDPDFSRCELARRIGADDARRDISGEEVVLATRGLGADAVIITASTRSNGPIELAANAVRQKGRVVLVGVVGLELDRRPFYFKEAEFVVSCSYGPGRYDPNYEGRGLDYPPAYVRWTEQRNIQAVLDMMGSQRLNVEPLISHRFPIERAQEAYDLIETGREPYLGIVIAYPELAAREPASRIELRPRRSGTGKVRCGVLGAGNFARMVLLPAIQKCGKLEIATICSAKGLTATSEATLFQAESSTTDAGSILADPSIEAVFCITRHDQHADHVIRAIDAGKNVFVEKPLCLTLEELLAIEAALERAGKAAPLLMVGFNRRFSPAARDLRKLFASIQAPLTISIRFNAGEIPPDHWTQHDQEGGGRLIGEACHAIDLATFLSASPPVRVFAESVRDPRHRKVTDDQCFMTLRHANGSVSSIGYLAGGDKAFPKERVEVFGGGCVGVIDDFRSVTTCRNGRMSTTKSQMHKGHLEEIQAFASALCDKRESPIPWDDLRAVTAASILAVRSLREGVPFDV
jgi:predicted dehydrogenase/D-arabinose 1-dehydrogenase-like Zn-dependent alcohol dehydrogenase